MCGTHPLDIGMMAEESSSEESVTDSIADGFSELRQYVPGFEVNNSCEFGVQIKKKTNDEVIAKGSFHLQSVSGEEEGDDEPHQCDNAYESPQEIPTNATQNVATANIHDPDSQQSTRSHNHNMVAVTSVRHAGVPDEILQPNCTMSKEAARRIIYEPSTSINCSSLIY